MMDIEILYDAIQDLLESTETPQNVSELASLYIVHDHLKNNARGDSESVVKEYDDILPAYKNYCDIKRKFQLHEIPDDAVVPALKSTCAEINDLIIALYCGTDFGKERKLILSMVESLYNHLNSLHNY